MTFLNLWTKELLQVEQTLKAPLKGQAFNPPTSRLSYWPAIGGINSIQVECLRDGTSL